MGMIVKYVLSYGRVIRSIPLSQITNRTLLGSLNNDNTSLGDPCVVNWLVYQVKQLCVQGSIRVVPGVWRWLGRSAWHDELVSDEAGLTWNGWMNRENFDAGRGNTILVISGSWQTWIRLWNKWLKENIYFWKVQSLLRLTLDETGSGWNKIGVHQGLGETRSECKIKTLQNDKKSRCGITFKDVKYVKKRQTLMNIIIKKRNS